MVYIYIYLFRYIYIFFLFKKVAPTLQRFPRQKTNQPAQDGTVKP